MPPLAVVAAGTELRDLNENATAAWIREALVLDARAEIVKSDLYQAYKSGAEAAGERRILSERAFVPILRAEMKRVGAAPLVEVKLTVGGRRVNGWRGVRLADGPVASMLTDDLIDDLLS